MYKILLCCSQGMSTSLLVNKMKSAAEDRNIEVNIQAIPVETVMNNLEGTQVVLLGPQVRFRENEIKNLCEPVGVKVAVINTVDYGMMKGDKVLESAISLI